MAIREPIELGWKGEKKNLVIDMLVIERVNNEIGVLNAGRVDPKNLDFVKMSKLYFILLTEVGFELEWMEVYDSIYQGTAKQKKAFFGNYNKICQMLMPDFGNPIAKKKATPKSKKKAKKK